tara:strand:- start:162 stop:551 length:390 start_codon:yes stop_codon:yes gene_type:complete
MKKILIEVSAGELLDKISILEIKLNKIQNSESLNLIKKEYQILITEKDKIVKNTKNIDSLYLQLKSINEKLWIIEDEKRLCEKNLNFKEKFIQLSRDVHFMNDERAQIKLQINKLVGSNITEIKQYTKY